MNSSKIVLGLFLAASYLGKANDAFADVSEASDCRVPQEIKFVREEVGFDYSTYRWKWSVNRYRRFYGEAGLSPMPGKNLEAWSEAGPSYGTNCTTGSVGKTVMQMTFKLKTFNYFNHVNQVGNHIAFGMKAELYSVDRPTPPWNPMYLVNGAQLGYRARGIIFHRDLGVRGEVFDNVDWTYNNGWEYAYQALEQTSQPLALYDNVEYNVNIYVSNSVVSYRVTDPWGNVADRMFASPYGWAESTQLSTTGDGFAVVVLCNNNANALMNCEVPFPPPDYPAFDVHLYDMNVYWY